jgi:hypothetical protein
MRETLAKLRQKVVVGFVGGSDLSKQKEQIGEDVIDLFDFSFAENGLTAYRLDKQLKSAVQFLVILEFYWFLGRGKIPETSQLYPCIHFKVEHSCKKRNIY